MTRKIEILVFFGLLFITNFLNYHFFLSFSELRGLFSNISSSQEVNLAYSEIRKHNLDFETSTKNSIEALQLDGEKYRCYFFFVRNPMRFNHDQSKPTRLIFCFDRSSGKPVGQI
jgi:hypothetical protein